MPEDEVKFCPLLTVVRSGQANYMVCQNNCVFYIDGECAFITTARSIKEIAKPKIIDMIRKEQKDES